MGGTVPPVAGNRRAGFRATLPMNARAIVPTAGISKGKRLCPHVQAAGQHEKERCMERNEEALSPLDGISVNINKRHAFVHERVLEYIVRETNQVGGVIFNKKEMASWLGCCPRSLDRAVHRLREQGNILELEYKPIVPQCPMEIGPAQHLVFDFLVQSFYIIDICNNGIGIIYIFVYLLPKIKIPCRRHIIGSGRCQISVKVYLDACRAGLVCCSAYGQV